MVALRLNQYGFFPSLSSSNSQSQCGDVISIFGKHTPTGTRSMFHLQNFKIRQCLAFSFKFFALSLCIRGIKDKKGKPNIAGYIKFFSFTRVSANSTILALGPVPVSISSTCFCTALSTVLYPQPKGDHDLELKLYLKSLEFRYEFLKRLMTV